MQLLISLKNSFLFFTNCSQQFYCIPISIIWHLQSHGFCIDECFDNLLFFACHGVLLAFTDFFFCRKVPKNEMTLRKSFLVQKSFLLLLVFFRQMTLRFPDLQKLPVRNLTTATKPLPESRPDRSGDFSIRAGEDFCWSDNSAFWKRGDKSD